MYRTTSVYLLKSEWMRMRNQDGESECMALCRLTRQPTPNASSTRLVSSLLLRLLSSRRLDARRLQADDLHPPFSPGMEPGLEP